MNPKFMNREEVFIIAEIGGNHEGNFAYAKKLLNDAAESGAHAIKFQTYHGDKLVSPVESAARNKHFKKFELANEQWIELANMCKEKGIMFMSSVWDEDSLELLDPHVQVHKIGSGDFTNYPLLEKIAKKNKPLIVSTAMADMEEVKDLVAFAKKVNSKIFEQNNFCLLHCVAMYGDPKDEYANLNSIKALQDEFPDIPIGYSDHTIGVNACNIAIEMGVCVIEKHFTDDKNREFRDHNISATIDEIKKIGGKGIPNDVLMGKYGKFPIKPIESKERIAEFRRAVYPLKDLEAGAILSEKNLTTLRPNKGIDARKYYDILGKKLNKTKQAFEPIYNEDLD